MKILVIGNGFISTSIVKRLESENHEVLVFSRTYNHELSCRQVLGDIFNFKEFVRVFDWNPQIVIHTAWITTPGIYRNDPSNFEYTRFTIDLAKYVAGSKVEHLIVLGTCAEYGYQSESCHAGITQLAPNTLYAQQKVHAFNSLRDVMQNTSIRFTWARIFYPYGPNQHHKRLVPYLIRSLKNKEPIVLDDITSIYDWISTRDIASAISWAVNHKLPTELDIGTSLGFTNLQLLSVLETLMKTSNKLLVGDNHILGNNETFVVSKSSALFTSGWLPEDSMLTGLEWMLSHEKT
jgi:nucleoside-diphosphate-sugar epimerase